MFISFLNFRTGGDWLVTDIARAKSVFKLFPDTLEQLKIDLEREGSDLAGIDAEFEFQEFQDNVLNDLSINQIEKISKTLSNTSFEAKIEIKPFDSLNNNPSPILAKFPLERATFLNGVKLKFAAYTTKYIYLCLNDRIRHGRHFTFKNLDTAVTFVAESVTGSYCTQSTPFVLMGYWLQILIPNKLVNDMANCFKDFQSPESINEKCLPLEFEWQSFNLKIVIDSVITKPQAYNL